MRAREIILVLSAALGCLFMATSQAQARDFEQQVEKTKPQVFENRPGQQSSDAGDWPDLPDRAIARAYERAAAQNVIAAVNPKVFFGYWSVCADGQGFGYGYTYPSLDGHQMTDALLWLGRVDVIKANWDYVRSFQRPDGALPIAVLPNLAGKQVGEGDHLATVAANGGLYAHWVPGNPLAALADPTYIQNADDIFRRTLDMNWLTAQLPTVNLAADHLASLVDDSGAVRGAGYYVERPARIEHDGVAQGHAVDAFRRVAALNRVAGNAERAKKYENLAERIRRNFVSRFWVKEKEQFAEYDNPQHGLISSHGLTDVDWAAIALDVATPEQVAVLWPKLKNDSGFYYGGMPTGIATRPENYEDWEFTHTDRHDLAAMGRVWFLDAQARSRMGDAEGLMRGIRRVCKEGTRNGYYWRERYQPDGRGGAKAVGPNTYCEYPANLIRIVQRFLLGVNMGLDGSVVLAPTVTNDFWRQGFGQTLRWRGRVLRYHMQSDRISGTYEGSGPQKLGVRFSPARPGTKVSALADGLPLDFKMENGLIFIILSQTQPGKPCEFEITRMGEK
ncbi:MAG: hypothetical protein ABSG73_07505 [Candidatus Aminicenantales bacterium]|jgi:hypothetical protein